MEVVAEIYSQFSRSLLAYIRSKIRCKEDAEDILQNVFIRIASHINTLSEKEKLKSWIFTITRNAIIDYYRANNKAQSAPFDESFLEHLEDDQTADSTQGLEHCLHSMINLLPEEYKSIIIDAELKGEKQKDLATKYNMAYPSMRSRVQRGRERLKQLLYNCCHIKTDTRGNIISAQGKKEDCSGPCDPCPEL
jgi:RNA polymerase sigma-70 factor, ECF subfamily